MGSGLRVGVLITILGVLLPTDARAEPIAVGTVQLSAPLMSGGGVFTKGDARVSVSGSGFVEAGACFLCPTGTVVSLSGSLSDLDGSVAFDSPGFRLPEVIEPGVFWRISMPFTLQALFYPVTTGPSGSFDGSGIVTGVFWTQRLETAINGETVVITPGVFFNFVSATYEAPGESLTATPEPASLLLIATGAFGLGLRSRFDRERPR